MLVSRVYATTIPVLKNIKEQVINPLMVLLFAAAVSYFFYGVWEMVKNADNDVARAKGRQHIMYGTIGLFIMVSVYGILNVICRTIECN